MYSHAAYKAAWADFALKPLAQPVMCLTHVLEHSSLTAQTQAG